MWRGLLTWAMIVLGWIIMIFWVFAFESLTTTPWATGNQSFGSQILSKLPSGGFNRATDSLQAIRQKLDTLPTTWWANSFTWCETKVQTPTSSSSTLTCSAWKTIRSHSFSCSWWWWFSYNCWVTSMTTTSLIWRGMVNQNNYGHGYINYYNYYSASILCCNG